MIKAINCNIFNKLDYLPYAHINLNAITRNAQTVKNNTDALVCAVVKSDGYGHGLVESAFAVNGYCNCFAVCTLSEGVTLRIAGVDKPIICLAPVNDITRACLYDITVCVNCLEYFNYLSEFCFKKKLFIKVHIAVNTGMNRLGIDNLAQLNKCLQPNAYISVTGIYSHFYNVASKLDTKAQFLRFLPFVERAKKSNASIIAHISASGGFVLDKNYHLDMVRIGIMLYGYSPIKTSLKLEKAMTVFAPLLQKRRLLVGENLLYGDYKTNKNLSVGIYAYGYANGERKPLFKQINNSCMNICASNKNKELFIVMKDASRVARKIKTIEYQVLTSFGNNCKRIYGQLDESYFGKI